MADSLRILKYKGLIKLKKYPGGQPDLAVPPNGTRIKLTSRGRKVFDIKSDSQEAS